MATTSSSSSAGPLPTVQPAIWVRRNGRRRPGAHSGAWQKFLLSDADRLGDQLSITPEGTVTVSDAYDIAVDLGTLGPTPALVDVNGEEIILGPPSGQTLLDDCPVTFYSPNTDGGVIFSGIYDYARVSLLVPMPNGSLRMLTTRDIPTLLPGDRDSEVERARAMLGTIMSPDGDSVADLMFAGAGSASERFSIIEGGYRNASGRSLSTFLRVVDEVVTGFERIGNALAAQSRTVVIREPMMVRGEATRTFGRKEAEWVSQNSNVLQLVHRQTAIEVEDRHYLPRRIETSRLTRSYDAYENRAIVSFIKHLLGALSAIESALEQQVVESDRINGIVGSAKGEEGYVLSALIVERSKAALSHASIGRVQGLRRRTMAVARFLERMWPDVSVPRSGFRRPRRTRVFQELSAYRAVYRLIEVYLNTGDCTLEREGLVLRTPRLDRIYEYYALNRLLDALMRAGFGPDGRYGNPSENFVYSLKDRYYRNETRVANTYHLARGETSVDLYYQPVLYGDGREENGISLHRTTGAFPFGAVREGDRTSYWTPDYLLVVHGKQGATRAVILDAKYSRVWSVIDRHPGEPYSGETLQRSRFGTCLRKYLLETASSRPGDARPSLWLLCGREDEALFMPYEAGWGLHMVDGEGPDGSDSTPSMQGTGYVPSGVLSLGPNANGFDRLLSLLGLTGLIDETEQEPQLEPVQRHQEEPLPRREPQDKEEPTVQSEPVQQSASQNLGSAPQPEPQRQEEPAPNNEGLTPEPSTSDVSSPEPAESNEEMKPEEPKVAPRKSKKSKPAKAASKKTTYNYAPLIEKIYGSQSGRIQLFGQPRWCSHPILRLKAPSGREAKFYAPIELDGEQLYVYTQWNPMTFTRLKKWAEGLDVEGE